MTALDQGALDHARLALVAARKRAGLTRAGLFFRYIALGGLASASQIVDHCTGGPMLGVAEHNVLAQALNERFLEVGDAERVPYL